MKKKPVFWIIVVVVAVLVVAGAVWGKQYYEGRYLGADYYTMVPLDYNMTPEMIYTMNGEEAGLGKKFTLTAYNEQGEAKTIMFTVYGEKSANFPQPGTYLYISANKEGLALSQSVITESKVPQKALEKIKAE